jgi:hypothetical protein
VVADILFCRMQLGLAKVSQVLPHEFRSNGMARAKWIDPLVVVAGSECCTGPPGRFVDDTTQLFRLSDSRTGRTPQAGYRRDAESTDPSDRR